LSNNLSPLLQSIMVASQEKYPDKLWIKW
jgi:hypothetical protein